jgi:hypothetical protein
MATMEAAPAMKAAPANKDGQSKDEKAAFWLAILSPVLLGILALLGGLGYMKWTKDQRAQTIFKLVKSGVHAFHKYAEGTDKEWDDAVAKLVGDINNYFLTTGQKELSEEEKSLVKKTASSQKAISGPDKPKAPEENE